MEKTITDNDITLSLKNIENDNNDMDISYDNIEKFFNNTINKYFIDEGYTLLQTEKQVLDHFYINEEFCLKYIKDNYKNKENRKLYKTLFLDSLLRLFKQKDKILKFSEIILKKLSKLNEKFFSDDNNKITLKLYYSKLKEEFNVENIPKFLIYDTKKKIKNIVFVREYENNLDKKIEESEIKNLIFCYQWLCYIRENGEPLKTFPNINIEIPDFSQPFDDIINNSDQKKNSQIKENIFKIFILSNSSVILYNEFTKKIFKKNYEKILSWFDININNKNFSYDNIFNTFISIPLTKVKELLDSFIKIFEIDIITIEQYYFIIASLFYCITIELSNIHEEKFKFNYLIDNTIHNLQKYLNKNNYDLKSMIAYLDYYQIKEYPKKINNHFNFLNIEKKFKDKTIPKLIEQRFENLIKKIKEMYSSNTNLIPLLINKLINFLTPKIDEITREKLELIPYSKNYYSSEITILISGFGAESDNHSKLWKNLISSNRRAMFYFYQWPGDSFIKIIIKSLPNKIPLINGIQIFDSSISNVFLSAKKRAKISGKILGLILSTRKFFDNCQINLIGFSLGTHVIKNCIKELYNLKIENNIINNVMFIAGATHIEQMKWNNIFNEVINGRIINCYSKNDYVLKYLFQSCVEKKPIGWDKLIVGDENNIKIENYDMSDLKLGHTDYRNRFEDVLKIVDL